jgi:peptidoglycan/xylan/chitin deacetylase (PgdA/CDA1 family)
VPRERTRATVLAYHFFGPRDTALMVTEEAFEAQMRWLAEHRVTTVTAAELASFLDGTLLLPERVAVVTIDDANVSVYERAFPILRKHRIRFTLALNTAAIEARLRDVLTWEMIREMAASGLCDLASHSHLHRRMDRLDDEANRREAEVSRAIIEERTGLRPDAFVFPLGAHSRRVREVLEEAGYRAAFGVGGAAVEHDSPRFQLPRVGVDRETTRTMFARLFSDQARRGKRAL